MLSALAQGLNASTAGYLANLSPKQVGQCMSRLRERYECDTTAQLMFQYGRAVERES